jgi:hypothetical protein
MMLGVFFCLSLKLLATERIGLYGLEKINKGSMS